MRDLLEQVEAARAELLGVAVALAHRLRVADPDSAEEAARAIQTERAALGESTILEAGVSAGVLGLVVAALRG